MSAAIEDRLAHHAEKSRQWVTRQKERKAEVHRRITGEFDALSLQAIEQVGRAALDLEEAAEEVLKMRAKVDAMQTRLLELERGGS